MTIGGSSALHDIFSGRTEYALAVLDKLNKERGAGIKYEIYDMCELAHALNRNLRPGNEYILSMTALFRVMVDSMMANNGDSSFEYLKEWSSYLAKKIRGDGDE